MRLPRVHFPRMYKKSTTKRGTKGITLRDVIAHIQATKGEVLLKIGKLEQRMGGLEQRMDGLSGDMKSMEKRLTERIDALEEDLTATMQDTVRIRTHVGMPVPME